MHLALPGVWLLKIQWIYNSLCHWWGVIWGRCKHPLLSLLSYILMLFNIQCCTYTKKPTGKMVRFDILCYNWQINGKMKPLRWVFILCLNVMQRWGCVELMYLYQEFASRYSSLWVFCLKLKEMIHPRAGFRHLPRDFYWGDGTLIAHLGYSWNYINAGTGSAPLIHLFSSLPLVCCCDFIKSALEITVNYKSSLPDEATP